MDFSEILTQRRSIRTFIDRPVPEQIVHDIITDCRLAPSSYNQQPWRLIIVRSRNMLQRLSDEAKKNNLERLRREPDSILIRDEADLLDPEYHVFYHAPCLVLVVGQTDIPSLDVDCALFAAYFMFSAANKGLGTCWVGLGSNIQDPEILAELGLPSAHRIVAPLIVGYPADIPAPSDRRSPEIINIIS